MKNKSLLRQMTPFVSEYQADIPQKAYFIVVALAGKLPLSQICTHAGYLTLRISAAG